MKKITKLFLALTLLVIGVIDANAEAKTYWDPSTAFGAGWNSETSTASWDKNGNGFYLLYTGFTPKVQNNSTPVDLSLYTKLVVNISSLEGVASDDKGGYIEFKVRSNGKSEQAIKLYEGENNIVFKEWADKIDFSKMLEITLSGTLASDAEAGSAVITEMYLYTDRYEYQKQEKEVRALGTALSLESIVSESTLVSIAAGESILYGTHADNQIYLKPIAEAMAAVDGRGANESTYRFRIVEATDADLTYPEGVTKLYRIRPYKGDGSVLYTGPWGGDGYLNDIGWTYNIAGSDDGCYFAIKAVADKQNTYTITSYKKDGTQRHANIYDKSEWTFSVLTTAKVQVDVLVEVFVPDTENPGIPAVAEGWISLISNGDLESSGTSSFATKDEFGPNGVGDAIGITSDAGRMSGNGLKIASKDGATNAWGTQFFILSKDVLKEGQKLHIEFDYRADRKATVPMQAHREPGNYNAELHNEKVNFTVNWQHYVNEITLNADETKNGGLYSIAFNLNEDRSTNNFYFDNIVLWTEDDPLKPERVALQNAIAKGNAQSSFAKTEDSFGALTNAITAAEGVVNSDDKTTLTNAKTAIENAITGLKLQNGYTNLTKDMYYNWSSATAPTYQSSGAGICDYVIGTSTGQPYGNGSVPLLTFADLSTFDNLYVLATGGTPRILLNRDVDGGQPNATESESHLIDNTNEGCMTWAAEYFTKEGSNVTVDLKKLAANKGFAHLHTIKTVGGNVTVSDMLLYRSLTIGETGKATFGTLYKNAKLNGATVSAVKYADGKVTLTPIEDGIVPAGVGVLVEGSGEIVPTFDVEAGSVDSDLKVSNGTVAGDGSTIYILADGNHGVGFYLLADNVEIPAGKAYLQVAAVGSESSREFIAIAGEATAIKTVETEKANGAIYNLAGQQVKKAQKGIFIMNGKKVIK